MNKKMISMKIRHKILILNLSLVFIPLILAGTLAFRVGVSTLSQVTGRSLQKDAAYVIDSMDRDLYERSTDLRSWAGPAVMQDVLRGDPDGRIASSLSEISEKHAGLYRELFCVNAKGVVIASANKYRTGMDVSKEAWFQKGVMEGVPYIGPVHAQGNAQENLIGIVQPIHNASDRSSVIGVLVSTFGWESFSGAVRLMNEGKEGELRDGCLTVVDDKGGVLFQFVSAEGAVRKFFPSDDPFLQKVMAGGAGFLVESGRDGKTYLSGFAHASGYKDGKGPDWSVILSIPRATAFAPVYHLGRQLSLVGVFCLILIPAIAILFSKGITRPITHMVDILKDIAGGEGDLTRHIEVQSNDEIKELADWMNTFIINIQGIVREIKETMKSVSESSRMISRNTEKLNAGTEEQGGSLQEISVSITAMDQMNRQVADNAKNLASHTEEASSSIIEMSASIDEVAENAKHASSAVEETSSSISEMVGSINEISNNIVSVSSNADQAASFTEEIDRSIQEVEKNAKNSLKISEQSVSKAEGGMTAVTQTQEGMVKIKETFEESARVIKRLGEKSVQIGKILKVIDEVADQTNLLALNAAIIAAQAGEHGKGFAVVADEIKALAERSAASTKDISAVIRSVQKEAEEAVQSMEVSSGSITRGMNLSLQAKEALLQMMESVDHSRTMVNEIAHAAIEQSKGSQMVKKAVEKITESLRQINKGTQEQKVGSKQIIENTERIREMINHVSRAMQEQAKGSGQIAKAIEETNYKTQEISKFTVSQTEKTQEVLSNSKTIEQIAERNAQQVQEMTQAISDMAEKVERLQSEIDTFKV